MFFIFNRLVLELGSPLKFFFVKDRIWNMEMDSKLQVCVACTQNCLLFHSSAKTSHTSFFKVITHQNDFRILYIPPMFSRTVSVLVDKEIILKDSSRQRWTVKVSHDDGSFVFKEGWNSFSLDHGLEIGELLIFNCINKLQFDVKIYGKSGCERLDFSKKRNQKKRSRGRSGSPKRDGMLVKQGPNASLVSEPDVPKLNTQHREVDLGGTWNSVENISKNDNDNDNGSAQSMYISEHCEDPCYMASLEFEDAERDNDTCGLGGTMKITAGDSKVLHVNHGSHMYQTNATSCNKDSMFKGILGTEAASDVSDLEMSGRNNSLSETDKSAYDKTSTLKIEENRENKSIMSDREVQVCQFTEGLGEISERGEKELVTPDVCSYKDKLGATGLPKVVKGELGHSSHSFNEDNECHFETAATDNDYLELPKCLPLSHRVKVRMERMVVLLRDPLMRLWPVLYHEQFKILTCGWLDFQRANNIQPADVCVFGIENESERIFNVHIVHKGC